jgi:L-threonylcarbamoyladenylate synthase
VLQRFTLDDLPAAARLLHDGGVVAYPTEAVYGLGCDPHDQGAFQRLFALKQRPPTQGVLLIAADFDQVERYIELASVPTDVLRQVRSSWPGPHTWIFPRSTEVPSWVAGAHAGIALRVTAHEPAAALCRAFGGALVSTSANPHGQPPARAAQTVADYFDEASLDGLLDAPLGDQTRPTVIRDALSGAIIRA